MKQLINLKRPTQSPDGATYSAIYAEATESVVLGIQGVTLDGVYGDVFVPVDNIDAVGSTPAEGDFEFGAHVWVI